MTIYLVQHGIALSKQQDAEQGLSDEGKEDVTRIAEVAKSYDVQVSCIWHSVKKRARQTAEIMASFLEPKGGLLEKQGLKPLDNITEFSGLISTSHNIMVIGHLPFLSRLVSLLITGNPDKPVFQFQNGGIMALDKNAENNNWIIKWTLMPKIG